MKKRIISSVLAISMLTLIISVCAGCSKNDNSSDNSSQTAIAENNAKQNEQKQFIEKIKDLIRNGQAYDAGEYEMLEIEDGQYAFINFNGNGYCKINLSDEIRGWENFVSFGYVKIYKGYSVKTNGILINCESFEELGVSGAKEIYEKMHGIENYDGPGMYWIDHDIPSGVYKIESKSGGSYHKCDSALGSIFWGSMINPYLNEYQDSCIVEVDNGLHDLSFIIFKGDKISPYKKTTNE